MSFVIKKIAGKASALMCAVVCATVFASCGGENEKEATATPKPTFVKTDYSERSDTVPLKEALAGDYVFFGRWEQDGNLANGSEKLSWLVLERKEDSILLLSEKCVERVKFHIVNFGAEWKNVFVREWLNVQFNESAFSEEEAELIKETTHTTHQNHEYQFRGDAETTEKVFLLEIDEVERYFKNDSDTVASNINIYGENRNVSWWLRNTGAAGDKAVFVRESGGIEYRGVNCYDGVGYARPAIWVQTA